MPNPRPFTLIASTIALAVLPFAACQGPPTLAQACQDRAVAICALFSGCQPHQLVSTFGDVATCQQQLILECTTDAKIVGPGYLPAAVEACAQEAAGSVCAALSFPAPVGPACAKVTESPDSLGPDACSSDLQCPHGPCDLADTFPQGLFPGCGQCENIVPVGAPCGGGSPGNPTRPCEIGAFCNTEEGSCLASAQSGDACDIATPFMCALGLRCEHSVCTPLLNAGDACDSATAAFCDPAQELTCDVQQGQCAAQPAVIRKVGESCAPGGPAAIFCGPRAFCAKSGVCQAIAEDGQGCDASAGVNACLFPDTCVDGVCGLPDPVACVK